MFENIQNVLKQNNFLKSIICLVLFPKNPQVFLLQWEGRVIGYYKNFIHLMWYIDVWDGHDFVPASCLYEFWLRHSATDHEKLN